MTRRPLRFHLATIALGAAVLTMPALAQTIGVHIENDDTADFFLTLIDENSGSAILTGERLNAGQRKDVDIRTDSNGKGSVTWEVKSADGAHCKADGKDGLGVGDTVDITAGTSSC